MTVLDVRTRLAALQARITGVRKAFAYPPRTLQPNELPAFINVGDSSSYDLTSHGEGQFLDTRLWRMQLYVKEAGQDAESEAEAACDPFIARVQQQFLARPGLELDVGDNLIFDTTLQGDSGALVRSYAGKPFIMIEFRLVVTDYLSISYRD